MHHGLVTMYCLHFAARVIKTFVQARFNNMKLKAIADKVKKKKKKKTFKIRPFNFIMNSNQENANNTFYIHYIQMLLQTEYRKRALRNAC